MTPKGFIGWVCALVVSLVIVLVVLPVLLVLALSALPAILEESVPESSNLVAVVELEGMITDVKKVISTLHRQAENDKVKGIVLRIDSPGGAVGPSQELFQTVKKLREKKPIVASMGSIAASGRLYAALPASKIFCQPGTLTGSIGVVVQVPNVSEAMGKVGVEMNSITSGMLKDAGSPFRPMSVGDRAYLQSTVNLAHEDFVKSVAEARGMDVREVRKFADGRVLLGSQALEVGLVDGFGTLHDASRAIFDLLGAPLAEGEYPKMFYPMEDGLDYFRDLIEVSSKFFSTFNSGTQLRFLYSMN